MAGSLITFQGSNPVPRAGYFVTPACGKGPGLLLLSDRAGLDPAILGLADLLGEEGYVVFAPDLPDCAIGDPDFTRGLEVVIASMTVLRSRPECTGALGTLGLGRGGALALLAAAMLPLAVAVVFDPAGLAEHDEPIHVRCPVGLHIGGRAGVLSAERLASLPLQISGPEPGDAAIFVYADQTKGFYLRGRPDYDRSAAQLAHSRVIGLLRRTLGPSYDLEALWEQHLACEFDRKDPAATMATMTADPVNINVPVMTGGVGHEQVLRYYREQFLGQMPADCRVVPVSRTVGTDRLVDEHLLCFTHDRVMDAMLPGVPPTGRAVELAVVVIVEFRGNKVAGEHIHWDQASLLAQVGLLDTATLGLPIGGRANARKLLDERILAEALARPEDVVHHPPIP
jgi:carboxymethylenebutenolidase